MAETVIDNGVSTTPSMQVPPDAAADAVRAGAGVAAQHRPVRGVSREARHREPRLVPRVLSALQDARRNVQQHRQAGVGRCVQAVRKVPTS